MTTGSRLEYIRTDVGVGISLSAGAVVGEGRVLTAAHQLVVVLNSAHASRVVGTEPASVPGRTARDARNVREGARGITLGTRSRGVELRLLGGRAAVEAGPLVEGTGNSEGAGEVHRNNIPNSGVEVLDGAVGVDVGKES